MDSRRWLCLALIAAGLMVPQAANAATVRCVPVSGPGCGASYATINAAVTAAASGDTVKIAAGTYAEAISTSKTLNFVGAGAGTLASSAGATVVSPATGTAFTLPNGGSLQALRAVGSAGFMGNPALAFVPTVNGTYDYSVTNVIGIGGTGTDITFGSGGAGLTAQSSASTRIVNLSVSGGAFQAGTGLGIIQGTAFQVAASSGGVLHATLANTSAVGPTASFGGQGFQANGGVTVEAVGLTATGVLGAQVSDSTATFSRSVIDGITGGLNVYDFSAGTPTNVTVVDSLVTATPTSAINAAAVAVTDGSGATAPTLTLRGSTVFARGVDPQYAVVSRPGSGAPVATINLQNTIARLETPAESDEADVAADRGVVTATNSDFATRLELNGGTAPAPGSGTNLTADPLFAPGGFTLQSTSPLIDHGSPAFVAAGELDLAGHPRSAGAAPDIGAFEYQPPAPPPPPPNVAPSLGKVSMTNTVFAPVAAGAASPHRARARVKRGTTFRYRLSEPATVSIAIERRARGVRARARARGRCVAPRHNRARAKKHKGKPCIRWVRAGRLKALQGAGSQKLPFSGRFKGKALKPGRYRARAVAKDSGAARSRERRISFRIVRAR